MSVVPGVLGSSFGLGTDATIVSHYSPFVTLGWVVSGLDTGGNRVLDETLTREEALIAHTRSNAYLFFQEKSLGSLEAGKQADLVVLDFGPVAHVQRAKVRQVGGSGQVAQPASAAQARQAQLAEPGQVPAAGEGADAVAGQVRP